MTSRPVVFYSETYGVAGAEGMMFHIVEHLDRRRWAPRVALPALPALQPLVQRFENEGIDVDQLSTSDTIPWRVRFAASYKYFRRVKPNVLYVTRPFLDAAIPEIVAGRFAGVPKIIVHEQFPTPVSGYGSSSDGSELRARGAIRWRPQLGLWKGKRILKRRLPISAAHQVIVPSNAMREVCVDQYYYPAARVHTIHNAVDCQKIAREMKQSGGARERLRISPGVPVLLCGARFSPEKGHKTLLQALSRVLVTFPDTVLLLAGDGPLKSELENLTDGLGCRAAVRFLGWRSDLPALFGACDVCVLPSLWDPFPIFVLEGMAAGRAVVACRIGGIPEAVEHGKTGLLVPPGNPEALAAALVNLLDSPEKKAAMGQAGKRRAEAEFSLPGMLSRIHALCDL